MSWKTRTALATGAGVALATAGVLAVANAATPAPASSPTSEPSSTSTSDPKVDELQSALHGLNDEIDGLAGRRGRRRHAEPERDRDAPRPT